MCVCYFFFLRAAVRAFSLACPANYCFVDTLHILSFLANERVHPTFSDQITSFSKACYYHIRQLRCIRPYLNMTTAWNDGRFAYWTVRLLFGHFAYWTLRLLVISPTRHFAYWTVRLLDSSPTRHFAYYLDSSPTDCSSFYQQDCQSKIKSDV